MIDSFQAGELVLSVPAPPTTWSPALPTNLLRVAALAVHSTSPLTSLDLYPLRRMSYIETRAGAAVSLRPAGAKPVVSSPHVDVAARLDDAFPDSAACRLEITSKNGRFHYSASLPFRAARATAAALNVSGKNPTSKPLVLAPGLNEVEWKLLKDSKTLDQGNAQVMCGPIDEPFWAKGVNDLDLHADAAGVRIFHERPGPLSGPHLSVADHGSRELNAELFVVPQGAPIPAALSLGARYDSKRHIDKGVKPLPCDVWLFVYRNQTRLPDIQTRMSGSASNNASDWTPLFPPSTH